MTLPEFRAYVQTWMLASSGGRLMIGGTRLSAAVRSWCRRVARLWLKLSGRPSPLAIWRESKIRARVLAAACSHDNPRSPYSLFLFCSVAQDAIDSPPFAPSELRDALEAHRAVDVSAAFASIPGGTATLNATIAALLVQQMLPRGLRDVPDGAINYILSCQRPDGAFAASASALEADLLSTGLALFALRCFGVRPTHDPRPALAEFFPEGGSFTATRRPDDTESDAEYAFYGLLAMGCC